MDLDTYTSFQNQTLFNGNKLNEYLTYDTLIKIYKFYDDSDNEDNMKLTEFLMTNSALYNTLANSINLQNIFINKEDIINSNLDLIDFTRVCYSELEEIQNTLNSEIPINMNDILKFIRKMYKIWLGCKPKYLEENYIEPSTNMFDVLYGAYANKLKQISKLSVFFL